MSTLVEKHICPNVPISKLRSEFQRVRGDRVAVKVVVF